MKKILFASSEAVPFIKTGGLADVVGSLPKYFDHKKYDVRVILPVFWGQKLTEYSIILSIMNFILQGIIPMVRFIRILKNLHFFQRQCWMHWNLLIFCRM